MYLSEHVQQNDQLTAPTVTSSRKFHLFFGRKPQVRDAGIRLTSMSSGIGFSNPDVSLLLARFLGFCAFI
jgi:hypothetical protein